MTSLSSVELFDCLHDFLHLFRTKVRAQVELSYPDLTLNEMRVLMHTGRSTEITQKQLIERSHTDKAQMARILAGLEDRGWLERTINPSDRRARCLRLTAEGTEIFSRLRGLQLQIADQLLSGFPQALQEQLQEQFRRMARQSYGHDG